MGEKCLCGHEHCCHDQTREIVFDAVDNFENPIFDSKGTQRQFTRIECVHCNSCLGDTPIL